MNNDEVRMEKVTDKSIQDAFDNNEYFNRLVKVEKILPAISATNIPNNLDEVIAYFDSVATPEYIDFIKNDAQSTYEMMPHHGYGTYMRNTWGLWHDSVLAKWFKNLGILQADDMYGIISKAYFNHVKGLPFDLDAEIKYYQDFWGK